MSPTRTGPFTLRTIGALVLEELHADLGHSTTAASAAKHLGDLTKLGFGVLSRRHYREEEQTNKNTTQKSATRKKEREKRKKKGKRIKEENNNGE